VVAATLAAAALVACGWNPSKPFDRKAPAVESAIKELRDGGDATAAVSSLEDYLSTGPCADGNIGTPETLRRRPDGTFDLGLSLFRIGESFGKRFGEEEADGGDPNAKGMRGAEVGCAIRVLQQIAVDEATPLELRARARYLEGNLDFLDGKYEDAVRAYDQALKLAPGVPDAGDRLGRDAAWNRAIALRREEDNKKKDAGHDASNDAHGDGGGSKDSGGGQDSGHDSGSDGGGKGGQDASHDSGGPDSSGKPDSGPPPPPQPQDAASPPPPPPSANQDERMLDQLESAPTVQQEAARKAAGQRRRVRGMADK